MGLQAMHRLHNVNITNQHLVWNDRKNIYYVGYDSVFRNCRIDIDVSARSLVVVRTRFIDCTIRVKRQLNNFPFDGAYFENCQLKGRFGGVDFGRNDSDAGCSSFFPEAGIVATDLSAARLDACRFLNCDLSTLKLPRWPCFTLCDLDTVRERALKLPWPGRTSFVLSEPGADPPGTVAVSWDARECCQQLGGTEAELKAVVEQVPGAIL